MHSALGDQKEMPRAFHLVLKLKIWKDTRGQDLIEYALMAGFVAVAAGAIMPNAATSEPDFQQSFERFDDRQFHRLTPVWKSKTQSHLRRRE